MLGHSLDRVVTSVISIADGSAVAKKLPSWIKAPLRRFRRIITRTIPSSERYDRWVKEFDALSDSDREGICAHIRDLDYKPLISVAAPVYETPEWTLTEAIGADYTRPITLMLPERIVAPPPWVGHIPFAFWIIDVVRPRRFVELGAHSGNSFCAFLQAAAAALAQGEYFAVDHWRGDEQTGGYDNEIYEDLKRYVETRYHRSSALLRMTFDQALAGFADRSIDLLHIDGLHTYEAVRHDFDAWLPKMSERGVVLLHDTAVRERNFGVYQLFAELAERYPTFQFVHSHGLGVVQTGTVAQPEPLARLLRGGGADSRGIDPHLYFERLGNSLVDRYCFEQLSNEVEVELANVRRRKQELETALASRFDLAKRILSSGFFDPRAYRENASVPDVDDLSLAQHYLDAGEAAGLVPSRHFDPRFYRDKNPDVASAGMNMLVHYIAHGRAEGRLRNKPNAVGQGTSESARTDYSPD